MPDALCHVHVARPSDGDCEVCGREACSRCLVAGTTGRVCRTCLGARDVRAESELQSIALLDLALSGAWLLFGTTVFGGLFEPYGLALPARLVAVALSFLCLMAGLAARNGHGSIRWLQPALVPFDVGFAAGLYVIVDWGRLTEPGLILWLYLAQSLVLLGLLGWSVVRVQAADARRLADIAYRRLRRATADVLPTPFPFYWAGSVMIWLLLQMAFLVAYTREAVPG